MANSRHTSLLDNGRLSFEAWIPYLHEHKDKPAVKALLDLLDGKLREGWLEIYANWKSESVNDLVQSLIAEQDERRVINERFRSRPGCRAIIEDEEYIRTQAGIAAVRSKYKSLSQDRGWDIIDGCIRFLGTERDMYRAALRERDREMAPFLEARARLEKLYRISPERPVLPDGWQGRSPNRDVQTLPELLRYLQRAVQVDDDIESLNEAIHNAYCLLRSQSISETPSLGGYPFVSEQRAIDFIDSLIDWLIDRIAPAKSVAEVKELANDLSLPQGVPASVESPSEKKTKRSTAKGDARIKLIAALSAHHQYLNGSCLNFEPVGNNQLADLADVVPSTASLFFAREFRGHPAYRKQCFDRAALIRSLKLLNGEISPHELSSGRTPGEGVD